MGGFGGQGEDGGEEEEDGAVLEEVLREAGVDWTEVERLTSDRKACKEKVAERMEHLDRWETQKGHGYRWEQGEKRLVRNVERGEEEELRYRYEGCGKVCGNKAGLVMHEQRMHRGNVSEIWEGFRTFDVEGQRVSHVRSCMGGGRYEAVRGM